MRRLGPLVGHLADLEEQLRRADAELVAVRIRNRDLRQALRAWGIHDTEAIFDMGTGVVELSRPNENLDLIRQRWTMTLRADHLRALADQIHTTDGRLGLRTTGGFIPVVDTMDRDCPRTEDGVHRPNDNGSQCVLCGWVSHR